MSNCPTAFSRRSVSLQPWEIPRNSIVADVPAGCWVALLALVSRHDEGSDLVHGARRLSATHANGSQRHRLGGQPGCRRRQTSTTSSRPDGQHLVHGTPRPRSPWANAGPGAELQLPGDEVVRPAQARRGIGFHGHRHTSYYPGVLPKGPDSRWHLYIATSTGRDGHHDPCQGGRRPKSLPARHRRSSDHDRESRWAGSTAQNASTSQKDRRAASPVAVSIPRRRAFCNAERAPSICTVGRRPRWTLHTSAGGGSRARDCGAAWRSGRLHGPRPRARRSPVRDRQTDSSGCRPGRGRPAGRTGDRLA